MGIRFLYENFADTATVTVSSEATGYEKSNIALRSPKDTWRSTAKISESVTFALTATQDIKALVIKNHNFTGVSVVKIEGDSAATFDSGGGGNPEVSVTLTVTSGQITYYWSANQAYKYWRITMAGNTPAYFEIGRVYLGSYFEPTRNFNDDFKPDWKDPSKITQATDGSPSVDEISGWNEFNFNFTGLNYADFLALDIIRKAIGKSDSFFITYNPSDLTTTFYGYCIDDIEIKHIYGYIYYNATVKFREET